MLNFLHWRAKKKCFYARTPEGEWQPGVRRTANEHGADGEDLLSISVGTDISKAHTGQAAEGKVEGSDVGAAHCRAAHCAVNVRSLQTFAQLMEPSFKAQTGEHRRRVTKNDGSYVATVWYRYILPKRNCMCMKSYVLFCMCVLMCQKQIVLRGWFVGAGQATITSPEINKAMS